MEHKYNPEIHHRHSIRLKDYDYTQAGEYFITICSWNRECLLGEIKDGKMVLNEMGNRVVFTWKDLPNHNPYIVLDEFIVMPNHVHGIIMITDIVGADSGPAPTNVDKRHGLPEIVRQFKTFSSKRINQIRNTPGVPVWQRNYYEHIIRNEDELNKIREYIINNPLKWAEDENNPVNIKQGVGAGSEPAPTGKNEF